jgi:hypothetical protein
MPTMTPTTHLDGLEAAEHLPLGSTLVVKDFSWGDFEERRDGNSGKLKDSKCLPGCAGVPAPEMFTLAETDGQTGALKAFRRLVPKLGK